MIFMLGFLVGGAVIGFLSYQYGIATGKIIQHKKEHPNAY